MKKIIMGLLLFSSSMHAADVDMQLQEAAANAQFGTVERWCVALCPRLRVRRLAKKRSAYRAVITDLLKAYEKVRAVETAANVAKCLAALALIGLSDVADIVVDEKTERSDKEVVAVVMEELWDDYLRVYTVGSEKDVLRLLVPLLRDKATQSDDMTLQKRIGVLVKKLNKQLFYASYEE